MVDETHYGCVDAHVRADRDFRGDRGSRAEARREAPSAHGLSAYDHDPFWSAAQDPCDGEISWAVSLYDQPWASWNPSVAFLESFQQVAS